MVFGMIQKWYPDPRLKRDLTVYYGNLSSRKIDVAVWCQCIHTWLKSGWWFGTFFTFPYIGNNHPNWLICFRGVETTNQMIKIPFLLAVNGKKKTTTSKRLYFFVDYQGLTMFISLRRSIIEGFFKWCRPRSHAVPVWRWSILVVSARPRLGNTRFWSSDPSESWKMLMTPRFGHVSVQGNTLLRRI